MQPKKIYSYDATLREGIQNAGITFTLEDKINLLKISDGLGISYIEAGNPASNPKDAEFFKAAKNIKLKNSVITAFGSTCHVGITPDRDPNIEALLAAKTDAVTIFGKANARQVTTVLQTTLEDNLKIIAETVAYLKFCGKEVIFDAEHYFDGFIDNPEYALAAVTTAKEAGASWVVLCDTNGGTFPTEISRGTKAAASILGDMVGIHAHNDIAMAEANAVIAVRNGASMVQMTFNGWGERCGNTNIFTAIPNLQLKLGYEMISESEVAKLVDVAKKVSEISNTNISSRAPYIGRNAFAHKAGMHIDAMTKDSIAFEHIDPKLIGADRHFLLSEVSGRSAVYQKVKKIAPWLDKNSPEITLILNKLKELEFLGYQFDGAGASFELLVKRELGLYTPHFKLISFNVNIQEPAQDEQIASAVIRLSVGGIEEVAGSVGNGPVNALDSAARKAIERFYPSIKDVHLSDYKVRVLDSNSATASMVRVLIESTDGIRAWSTVGVSSDVVAASWTALVDSLEYKLSL